MRKKKELISENKLFSAKRLKIARSTLYYQPVQPFKDWQTKIQIEKVLRIRHSYGHKRIARTLKINKKEF